MGPVRESGPRQGPEFIQDWVSSVTEVLERKTGHVAWAHIEEGPPSGAYGSSRAPRPPSWANTRPSSWWDPFQVAQVGRVGVGGA